MIKEIVSKDNRIIKLCTQLASKKYRDREGLYLIEGPNLIDEAIKNNASFRSIIVKKNQGWTSKISGPDIYILEENLFDAIATTDTTQGVMAIVEKPCQDLDKLIEDDFNSGGKGNLVVLDRLQDPGNIGTIIRTADAAGYMAAIILKGTADVYSPKVVRSAAGSIFRLPIFFVEDNDELAELTKKLKKRLVATAFDTEKYYYDENLSRGIALIIGNEGNGIAPELIERADIKIKIPMKGTIESLNASVAAAIIMYETMRYNK